MAPQTKLPEEPKYVAFISWQRWPSGAKNRALKHGKYHLGRLNADKSVRSLCRCHENYPLQREYVEIFLGRVDYDRVCLFCLDYRPSFWHKLQQTEAPPKLSYFIIDMTKDQTVVRVVDDEFVAARMLRAHPDHLESINQPNSKLWIIKGSLAELDFSITKTVNHLKIKE